MQLIKKEKELAPRHKKFAEKFAETNNQLQSALFAGYSPVSAQTTAWRLLTNPKVKELVDRIRKEMFDALGITRERVMQEMARIAFFDPRQLFYENGDLIPITELPAEVAAVVSNLEVYEETIEGMKVGETKKVKLWSKDKQLEMLAKHFKIFTEAPAAAIQVNVQINKDEVRSISKQLDEDI